MMVRERKTFTAEVDREGEGILVINLRGSRLALYLRGSRFSRLSLYYSQTQDIL